MPSLPSLLIINQRSAQIKFSATDLCILRLRSFSARSSTLLIHYLNGGLDGCFSISLSYMALLQVFHTLVVVVTLVGSLTEAVVFRPNAIYVASGQYGKPTWRGSLVTPDLSHLPANQIKDQVERLARDAWDRAYESSTTFRIPDGENFAMAALWVPEKRKVHFGTQPKGNYLTTLKKSPPPGLTSRDVDPNIHAELYAYSNAMADGALPGPGSYMGVVGRMYDSKGTRIALHGPC